MNQPYRQPESRPAEMLVWETVHVTNVGYMVLAGQRNGWTLKKVEEVIKGVTQRLVFER